MPTTTLQDSATKKVLIVEDEGEMCLLLNILLTGEKMDLDHVKNLSAAGEYLKTQQPSVVILDNRLPDGLGVDYISYIKQNYPSIRIIMISGVDPAAGDIALYNGADCFLQKPFTKDQLCNKIKELVN